MTEEKFREIYREYYPVVKKVIYSILYDADLAEDVCQEVFILFAEKMDTAEEKYYRNWFLINARRKAIDFCRKAYQVHEITVVSSEVDTLLGEMDITWNSFDKTDDIEDEITHRIALRELAGKLLRSLAKKNSDWYEIVIRMHIKGEDTKEIARALGISVESLRAKKHRIKVWLNKHYRDKYEDI